MAHVLLVDDDRSLLDALSLALESEPHRVTTAANGADALRLVMSAQASATAGEMPDLIVSDVNMPELDGFALCKRLRDRGVLVPIVLLTSRDTEVEEALGLELGADDYVTKPFSTRVLLARIAALLRRDARRRAPVSPVSPAPVVDANAQKAKTTIGHLTLDAECLEARYQGVLLLLTLTEFRLLEALASRPGVVLSRSRLLEIARGDESVVADRIVDTYVRRLRKKFSEIEAEFGQIETLVGAGYRWRR